MTLKLQFYKDENASAPIDELSLPIESRGMGSGLGAVYSGKIEWSRKAKNRWGHFPDWIYVESELEEAKSDEKIEGLYQVKLAYRPDYAPKTNASGVFCDKDAKRMQLLRGASGKSKLRLLRRTNWTEDYTFEAIAEFDIDVEPSKEKKALLNAMVDELVQINSSAVLSELEGLSKTNLNKKWFSTLRAAPFWDIVTRVVECENLINNISRHLRDISFRCTGSVVREYRRINKEKMGRISPRTRRDMNRMSPSAMSCHKVMAPVLSMSYDVPIHRAIKSFLLYFKNLVLKLQGELKKSIEDDNERLKEVPAVDEYLPKDIKSEIDFKKNLFGKAEAILKKCQSFLVDLYPWMKCSAIADSSLDCFWGVDVPNTEAYKCTYKLMLEFLQKRNFRGALEGRFYVPQYVRNHNDNEEPSTWQKNYSFIYEAWVFKRLVGAFMSEGFKELGTSYAQQVIRCIREIHLGPVINEPICAMINDEALRVQLFYGIIAYSNNETNVKGFTTKYRNSRSTPDYAIVFSDSKDSERQCWIVLDAKSGGKLAKKDVDKRNEYSSVIKFKSKKPNQAWLIYSGPKQGSAKIEFNPDEVQCDVGRSWTPELEGSHPLDCNDKVKYSKEGFSGEVDYTGKYVGHVRANVSTIADNDVFSEFAKGQIAIARKMLAI